MSFPQVPVTALDRPYWDGLARGEVRYQHCSGCGHRWLPAREHCPQCLGEKASWETSNGRGRIVSWVVYHIAYHEAFETKLPYNVAIVEIGEGPRMLTNIVEQSAGRQLEIGASVELAVEYEGEQVLARFRLSETT